MKLRYKVFLGIVSLVAVLYVVEEINREGYIRGYADARAYYEERLAGELKYERDKNFVAGVNSADQSLAELNSLRKQNNDLMEQLNALKKAPLPQTVFTVPEGPLVNRH